MTQPTLLLSPVKSAISAQGGTLEVMLRVQAPDQPVEGKTKTIHKQWDGRSHLNGIVVCQSGDANQPLEQKERPI